MTDLQSEDARRRIADSAAPYFVRVDVPTAPDQPETWVNEAGLPDAEACIAFCHNALTERGVVEDAAATDVETFLNVQIRVWLRSADASVGLVFDRTCLPWAVPAVLDEFLGQPDHLPLPALSDQARASQESLGGPYESEHALLVAIAKRGGAQPLENS